MAKKIYTSANEELEILQYIESTGTQYIDTGLYAGPNTKVEISFQFTDLTVQQRLFATGENSNFYFQSYINGTGYYAFAYQNDAGNWISSGITVDKERHTIVLDGYNKIFTIDNTYSASLSSYNATKTSTASLNLLYFNEGNKKGIGKLYYSKIYENNVLVRDFIPVLDGKNRACLYDKVTQKKFFNKGTGDFIAGYVAKEIEYIESTGTQYIDTGVSGNAIGTFEIKFSTTGSKKVDWEQYFSGDKEAPTGKLYEANGNVNFQSANVSGIGLFSLTDNNAHIVSTTNNSILVDGVSKSSFTPQKWGTLSYYIFNGHGESTLNSSMRLYYLKMYSNNTLVRDYVPYIDEKGVPCLYDKIENKYYYNLGTGTFLAGEIISNFEKININNSKEVKKIYTTIPSSTVTITNLCPTANGANGFNVGGGSTNAIESSTTHIKYSANSLKLIGSANHAEVCAESTTTIPLNSKHIYYGRIESYQEVAGGGIDLYWPIAEPNFFSYSGAGNVNKWVMHSRIVDRSSFEDGNYSFRLDFNNSYTANEIWYDGWMIIDLTEAFGAGNEPTKEWCDENIPFFESSFTIGRPESTFITRKVKKGYIGINGVAKLFFSKEYKINYRGAVSALPGKRYLLAGASNSNYAFFGGGSYWASTSSDEIHYNTVVAYDKNLVQRTAASLTSVAHGLGGAGNSNYAILGGGSSSGDYTPNLKWDAYDTSMVKHTLTPLTHAHGNAYGVSASFNNYALFACGLQNQSGSSYINSNLVEGYDSNLTKVSASNASNGYESACACSKKYMLIGGGYANGRKDTVCAYNTSLTRLTNLALSQPKDLMGAASVGGKYILFAGGDYTGSETYTSEVDIFNDNLVKITGTALSRGRHEIVGCSTEPFAFFMGGDRNNSSSVIRSGDVYDENLVRTTPSSLTTAGGFDMGTAVLGKYVFFAGGWTKKVSASYQQSGVDVYQID